MSRHALVTVAPGFPAFFVSFTAPIHWNDTGVTLLGAIWYPGKTTMTERVEFPRGEQLGEATGRGRSG